MPPLAKQSSFNLALMGIDQRLVAKNWRRRMRWETALITDGRIADSFLRLVASDLRRLVNLRHIPDAIQTLFQQVCFLHDARN